MGLALLKGLRHHEDYSLQGNPDKEGKDIIRKSNPLLTVMPDESVQLAHSSLREFFLETTEEDRNEIDSASKNFRFEITKSHGIVASCLLTYLSFECFNDGSREGRTSSIGNALLDYSTLYLIPHSIQSLPSTKLAGMLVLFFSSEHGWRWLQRLEMEHGISFGHLQLMQSQLKSWSNSPIISNVSRNVLSGFLLRLAEQRYEDSRELHGEHKVRLAAMSALANSCRQHEKYDRAEELEVQVMETRKRVLGAEHPDTLSSMANLASTQWNQGRWTEAEKLFMQVIETSLRVLGAEHPDTLSSMANLAHTYKVEDRHDEAVKLMKSVVDLRTQKIGANHPYTLDAFNSLNAWLRNRNQLLYPKHKIASCLGLLLSECPKERSHGVVSKGSVDDVRYLSAAPQQGFMEEKHD